MSENLKQSLEEILNELSEENLDTLTEPELLEYRKALNPYGRIIEGSDRVLTFSYTNLREKYLEKLLATSFIGFLNAECDSYHVPLGHPVVPVYDYTKDPSVLDKHYESWTITDKIQQEIEENKAWMQKRIVIKEFLEELFQYNSDVHVRSSYKPSVKDKARGLVDTPAANLAVSELNARDVKFREQMLEYDRVQKLIAMSEGVIDPVLDNLVTKKLVKPEQHYRNVEFEDWKKEDLNLLYTACNMIPPVDMFGKFRTYYDTNYDKLREAVLHLYCEKVDLDIAICPHSWHEDTEEANEYVKKHKNSVITDIIQAKSGMWNLLANFSQVRESTKFYNDDTEILESIAEQIEQDSKLGAELMKNRVKQMKKKNIEEQGEDAEYFKNWKKDNNSLKEMKGVSTDDFSPDDIPDNSLEVPVYRISGGKFEKTRFFTKAVEPKALEASK